MSKYLGERHKLTLRIDHNLNRRLTIFASAENCSINDLIINWLNKAVDDRYKTYIKLVAELNKKEDPSI